MNVVQDQFLKVKNFDELLEKYKDNSPVYIYGLLDNVRSHFLSSFFEFTKAPIIYIAENKNKAYDLVDDINSILPETAFFMPDIEMSFYNIKNVNAELKNQRLECLIKLLNKQRVIIVTTARALCHKLTKKSYLKKNIIEINLESIVDINELKAKFIKLKYEFVKMVESKGQFSIRGAIIDFWSVDSEYPCRIELFDDEIDSIRFFDSDSQRSIEQIKQVKIMPADEMIFSEKDLEYIEDKIKRDIQKRKDHPIYEADNDKAVSKFEDILSFLKQDMYIANEDLIINYLKKDSFSYITDYLDKDSIIISGDIARIYDNYSDLNNLFLEDIAYNINAGEVFESHEKMYIEFDELIKRFQNFSVINMTELMRQTRIFKPNYTLEIKTIEQENFNRDIKYFVSSLINLSKRNEKSLIFASNLENAKNLEKLFIENDFYPAIKEDLNFELKNGEIIIIANSLSKGYKIHETNLNVFTHSEIYGAKRFNIKKRKKKPSSGDIINYSDLEIGDYVVHENNGIGRYKGIENIKITDTAKDYLVIEYKKSDRLYLPIDQISLLHKYVGNGDSKPKLSQLGSNEWSKTKARAKKSIDEIAEDLVKLYAKRMNEKGYAFSKDTTWQKEFEDSFIYEETYSQLRSIKEIKNDMQEEKPMDRLLCGDVGYGKTEVALRAAFKAINDGKQVAFLVPTTILAKQHYKTMLERFKNFPVTARMLSRFETKKNQDKTIKDLKKGLVDIVVGTHRILSKDVKFKDLGLLIIDEEQRFGVKHKEKLKKIKENVDVLTLSATPIPRTLQMSLVGIRDMSTLDEPPENRTPINTYVTEFDKSLIRSAILKEIERGGQVYFVYNRVYDMDLVYRDLIQLVPEAKITMAHGQMTAKQLENVMNDFIDGEIDVLLSTTIIETGMDIQNVNTIIVYDADMMGLSQLYQLKGRIGRSNRSSYAYFTYRPNKILTEVGEKRLKAIKDFSDFGSGYKIAMRDLELRGAGNILGESQSGHVDAIGYDLYVKYLKEAVESINNNTETKKSKDDVYIDIKIDGYIPDSYIEDEAQKIHFYNTIAHIDDISDYDEVLEDLIDRYGDIPVSVDNIMYVSLVKSLASENGFYEIVERKNTIYLKYKDRNKFSFEQLSRINSECDLTIGYDLSSNPSFKLKASKTKLLDCYNLLTIIDNIRKEINNE